TLKVPRSSLQPWQPSFHKRLLASRWSRTTTSNLDRRSVLVQPEMERGRSPLVSIPQGRDFQGIKVCRSDEDLEAAQGTGSGAALHRFDEPTRLSLGMVASPHSLFPFRPARSS